MLLALEVEHLTADHSRSSGAFCHQPDRAAILRGAGEFISDRRFERLGEQSVSGEQGVRIAVDDVICRLSAPQVVVVHAGQIVVNERVGVYHLNGAGIGHRRLISRVGVTPGRERGKSREFES